LVTEVAVQLSRAAIVAGDGQLDVLDPPLARFRFRPLHEEPPETFAAGVANDAHGGDLEQPATVDGLALLRQPEVPEVAPAVPFQDPEPGIGCAESLLREAVQLGEDPRPPF